MSIHTAIIVPHPPLLVPEVGQGKELSILDTRTAYQKAVQAIAEDKPETVIVISPHALAYQDYIYISAGDKIREDLRSFGGKEVIEAKIDRALADRISSISQHEAIPAGSDGHAPYGQDHATYVPLYFLNQVWPKDIPPYKVIVCSLSGLPKVMHYYFGLRIRQAAEELGRSIAVIASGDLSHKLKEDGPYGFAKEGPILDGQLTDIMKSGNLREFLDMDEGLCRKGAECGVGSFVTMAGMFDRIPVTTEFLSYENTFGVGYACCIIKAENKSE